MKPKLILGLALFLLVPFSHSLASEPSTDRPPKKLVHHWQYITFPWTLPDEKQCPSFLCGYDENTGLGLRLEIMDIMPEFFKTNVINARLYRADGEIVEPTVEGEKNLNVPISINTAKPKPLLCLALVLSGGLLCGSGIAQPSGLAGGYDWGNAAGGFEMAVSLDQTNGIIHCRIRNATTNEMDYPSFDIGYFEDIRLEFQGATNWITIPTEVFPRAAGYSSACPYLVKRIGSQQIITDTYIRSEYRQPWPVQSLEEYLKWTHGNTNEARLTEQLNQRYADREALLTRLCRDDTFALDLFRGRVLPVLPEQNLVAVRVSQTLRTKPESMVTLYSPVFTVEKSFLQACLRQNLDRHEK